MPTSPRRPATVLDFVDVPGHDRLVGNMLVGAGEIDGCLLVVAADDGPRAQTLEHLALLDALALREGVAVVTKADLADADRVAEVEAVVRDQLDATTLRDIPVLAVSATSGAGLDRLASELASIAARPAARYLTDGPARLAIDRVFSIRGRGVVVTGSARGAPIEVGQRLRVLPGSGEVRVRGMEVHDEPVDRGPSGGRVALLVGGDAVETAPARARPGRTRRSARRVRDGRHAAAPRRAVATVVGGARPWRGCLAPGP